MSNNILYTVLTTRILEYQALLVVIQVEKFIMTAMGLLVKDELMQVRNIRYVITQSGIIQSSSPFYIHRDPSQQCCHLLSHTWIETIKHHCQFWRMRKIGEGMTLLKYHGG
jgi:hypothetical protein